MSVSNLVSFRVVARKHNTSLALLLQDACEAVTTGACTAPQALQIRGALATVRKARPPRRLSKGAQALQRSALLCCCCVVICLFVCVLFSIYLRVSLFLLSLSPCGVAYCCCCCTSLPSRWKSRSEPFGGTIDAADTTGEAEIDVPDVAGCCSAGGGVVGVEPYSEAACECGVECGVAAPEAAVDDSALPQTPLCTGAELAVGMAWRTCWCWCWCACAWCWNVLVLVGGRGTEGPDSSSISAQPQAMMETRPWLWRSCGGTCSTPCFHSTFTSRPNAYMEPLGMGMLRVVPCLACRNEMSRSAPKDAATVRFCGQFGVNAARSWC